MTRTIPTTRTGSYSVVRSKIADYVSDRNFYIGNNDLVKKNRVTGHKKRLKKV